MRLAWLSGELGYDICVLNLSDAGLTDDRLAHALSTTPPQATSRGKWGEGIRGTGEGWQKTAGEVGGWWGEESAMLERGQVMQRRGGGRGGDLWIAGGERGWERKGVEARCEEG